MKTKIIYSLFYFYFNVIDESVSLCILSERTIAVGCAMATVFYCMFIEMAFYDCTLSSPLWCVAIDKFALATPLSMYVQS